MKWLMGLAIFVALVSSSSFVGFLQEALTFTPNPDATLSTDQIIRKNGYPVETYHVKTIDGHNLTLFRIPHGLSVNSTKGPVLLQHGLICSSNDWLLNAPTNTLPYMLADQGYDVFIGNARGTNYSANNINKLSPQGVDYWNFSWHEMGVYDVPAVLDFVLNKTGSTDLFYVGHSMGTTMFFVAMSERPDYNAKIKGMFGLAPAAFFGHTSSPLITALTPLAIGNAFYNLETLLGQGQLFPAPVIALVNLLGPTLCRGITGQLACDNLMFLLGGYDPYQIDSFTLSNIVGHSPSSTSVRTLSHCLQLKNNPGKFRQYDWGALKNLAIYNTTTPPSYNLTRITAPVHLHWGEADLLVDPQDVALLNATKCKTIKKSRLLLLESLRLHLW